MRSIRRSVSVILVSFAAFISCAGTQKTAEQAFLCRDHGIHHPENKDEFCACFGIDPAAVSGYFVFSKESAISGDENSTAAALRDSVADDIVDMIVKRLDAAFGMDAIAHWQFDKIDLPVIFRSFRKNTPDGVRIKVIAVSLKENFTPRALIRFLPLEYKMKLLKPEDKYKDDFLPPR
jgi:hypothetical protein